MAADLNRVTLVGRLTRDPELRHTAGGDGIASLRLACSSRGKDESGQWMDKPNYFDVTVFGRQAESVAQYLGKGRRVGVDGRLQWREWEASDGSRRQAVEVVAQDVFFLDTAADRDTAHAHGGGAPTPKPTLDDDIPFAPSWI